MDAPVLAQATADWDQVWLTLPSEALHSPWLAKQLAVFSADTPLISWTPNFRDRETLSQLYKGPIQHAPHGPASASAAFPFDGLSGAQGSSHSPRGLFALSL